MTIESIEPGDCISLEKGNVVFARNGDKKTLNSRINELVSDQRSFLTFVQSIAEMNGLNFEINLGSDRPSYTFTPRNVLANWG